MSRAHLAAVEEEIIKCMRCGNCQAVCPLYKETRWEPAVARGKIRLAQAVLKDELPCTVGLKRRFDLCLTCMACVANCPSGVRVDRIILAARAALAGACGLPVPARTALGLMRRPGLFEGVIRTLSHVQGLFFKHRAGGMTPRFPLGLEWRRVFPPLAAVPFKGRVPEENLLGQVFRHPNIAHDPRQRRDQLRGFDLPDGLDRAMGVGWVHGSGPLHAASATPLRTAS